MVSQGSVHWEGPPPKSKTRCFASETLIERRLRHADTSATHSHLLHAAVAWSAGVSSSFLGAYVQDPEVARQRAVMCTGQRTPL